MKTTEKKLLCNEEIASFCSQAAMLFQAGIPPVEGMAILQSDAQSPEGKAIFDEILTVCRQGESFHKALKATGVFPDYCLHMIALGEESGNLDVCMSSLADYYEKEDTIANSIRDAVTYPFIMIAMMAAVIVVLVSRVMPIFEQVYVELGSEMTGFAASLLHLGNHLNRYSFIFVSILCVILLLYLFATRTQTGKRATARFLNWFPLTRRFYESVACERFASGMALTLSSGMDTYSSLDMVAALVGNEKMKQKILSCKETISAGANFAEALTGAGIFNHLYSQMVSVGFRSGNVDVVLKKIADRYEENTNRKLQSIIAVLEPTLVILLSVIVGLILLSVILPLMGIMTSIGIGVLLMNRFEQKSISLGRRLIYLLPILAFLVLFVLFVRGIGSVSESTLSKQQESLETALERSISQCYAVEGSYPPSLEYLKQHYGLLYDEDSFFIDYEYYGSNLLPEVTVLRRTVGR